MTWFRSHIGDVVRADRAGGHVARATWRGEPWTAAKFPNAQELWGAAKFEYNGRLWSLKELTVELSDRQKLGSDNEGIELRRVPYPHIALVARSFPSDSNIQSDLGSCMKSTWGEGYIDPYKSCQVGLFPSSRAREPGTVLWGEGIFVPAPDELPIGDIDFSSFDVAKGVWSTFEPITIGTTATPAGLYRAQSALLFSGDPEATVGCNIWLRDGDFAPQFRLYGARSVSGDPGRIKLAPANIQSARYPIEPEKIPGYDGGFHVGQYTPIAFRLAYRLDNRSSRFLPDRPQRGYAIVGLLAPGGHVSRWWVNLDSKDKLVSSAMTQVERTLIVRGGTLERFNWHDTKRFKEMELASMISLEIGGRTRQALLFNEPAGYLGALPETPPPLLWVAGHKRASLDWLDFAGAAEVGRMRRRSGLAELQLTAGESDGGNTAGGQSSSDVLLGPLILRPI
jgi:hypothetical protein